MALSTLPASTRFITPGVTRVFYATALSTGSSTMIPSVGTDLTASTTTEVTAELAEWSGWSVSSSTVEVPDLVSDFVPTIPGRSKAEDSSLTFYADKAGTDARGVFTRDAVGWVIFADNGITSTKKVDVFAVRVVSVMTQRGPVDGGSPSKIQVSFALYKAPALNVALAA